MNVSVDKSLVQCPFKGNSVGHVIKKCFLLVKMGTVKNLSTA